jgi:hypothetical protein
MDRSTAMPRSAWLVIRDSDGALIDAIPATIDGGQVRAPVPAFPPGTRGTIRLCTDQAGPIDLERPEITDLPTSRGTFTADLG